MEHMLTDHLSSTSSVLRCRLRLPPAMQPCSACFFFQVSFPGTSGWLFSSAALQCPLTPLSSPVLYSVAAPTVWNSLPAHRCSTLISRRQFRDGLKSHLCADAYFWSSENIRYKSVMYLLTYLLTYLLFLLALAPVILP